MAITSVPTVLSQNVDAYINAGSTSRIQTFSTTNGSITINPSNGAFARLVSPNGSCTISFVGIPSGYANQWYVEVYNKLSQTVTFSGVTWDGGSAPTLPTGANKSSLLVFYSPDGGTTIFGKQIIANA